MQGSYNVEQKKEDILYIESLGEKWQNYTILLRDAKHTEAIKP